MATQLDALKKITTVVADSGDFDSFKDLKPQDATTNPTLLFQAAQMEHYQDLVKSALDYAREESLKLEEQIPLTLDKLAVNFGAEILKIIPGRVSTEIDARLSFDTEATLKKARELHRLYEDVGVDPSTRVLFKIASTWEGIQAAKQLEKEGLHCNMTLIFGFPQAVAAAEAKVTLVSPFVGRITDFWKKEKGVASFSIAEDPGVLSVKKIYNYYKKYGFKTIVMGASFRSKEQILGLAGCDYLTIAPNLLKQLSESKDKVERVLSPEFATKADIPKVSYDEKKFRWEVNDDPCATVKLAEGIRNFANDTVKLEDYIRGKLSTKKAKLSK